MRKVLSAACIAIIAATACKKLNDGYRSIEVNSTTSVAEWNGNAKGHGHVRSFQVQGSVTAKRDETIKEGNFNIPIASVKDFDLPDPTREVLLTDLRNSFFLK